MSPSLRNEAELLLHREPTLKRADFDREYKTEKWCASTCTLQCVHQVGILDNWRDPQQVPGMTTPESSVKDTIQEILSAE